jgi:hypothetical protein
MLFCLDVSGSMEGEKLRNVKDCISFVLNYMGPEDLISVVTFSDTAKVIIKQMRTAPDALDTIRLMVNRIQVEGMTNLGAGLLSIRDCILPETEGQVSIHKQGILVLTDGIVNVGITDNAGLVSLLELIHASHPTMTTTTVGYGTDHQAELLRALAATGTGSYNIVQAREEAASVFGAILGTMISVAAAGVSVQVPSDAKVHGPIQATAGKLQIGDINADAKKTFVIDVPAATETLTVSGYHSYAKSMLEFTVDLVPADAAAERLTETTMLRYEVAGLLDSMKGYLTPERRAELKAVATALRVRVDAVAAGGSDPVLVLLTDEIKYIQGLLEQAHMSMGDISMLTQHAAYVGTGAGMRGVSGGPATQEADDVFSSPLSRMVSGGCRQMSQPMGCAASAEDPYTTPVRSIPPPPFPPTLRRSNAVCYDPDDPAFATGIAAGGVAMPPSRQYAGGGIAAGGVIMPPPFPSLARQVAGAPYPIPPSLSGVGVGAGFGAAAYLSPIPLTRQNAGLGIDPSGQMSDEYIQQLNESLN